MNLGLVISFAVHALLLAWALVTIQRVQPFKLPEQIPVEVAIITADEMVRLTQGDRQSKVLDAAGSDGTSKKEPAKPAKTPPPPPPAAAAPPPPPIAAEAKSDPIAEQLAALKDLPPPKAKEPPPPPPGPSAEEKKKLDDAVKAEEAKAAEAAERAKAAAEAKAKSDSEAKAKAAEERQKKLAEQRRRAEATRKKAAAAAKAKADAEAKAKEFNPDDILKTIETASDSGPKQALIDKAKPKPAAAAGQKQAANSKGPRAGAPDGKDSQLTAGERSRLVGIMRDQLARCWNINSGHPDAARMQPVLQFELNRDGSLRGEPAIANPDSSPAFQDAANAARRALRCASPFRDLPQELYEHWEFASFRFDPSQMYR